MSTVVRLQAPAGTVGGLTISGRFYEVDEHGDLTVLAAHEAAALQMGCRRTGGDMPATPITKDDESA